MVKLESKTFNSNFNVPIPFYRTRENGQICNGLAWYALNLGLNIIQCLHYFIIIIIIFLEAQIGGGGHH